MGMLLMVLEYCLAATIVVYTGILLIKLIEQYFGKDK